MAKAVDPTPGPWTVEERRLCFRVVDARGREVALLFPALLDAERLGGDTRYPDEAVEKGATADAVAEARANADLISAAPELRAACRRSDTAWKWFRAVATLREDHQEAREGAEQVKAALAKAVGQSTGDSPYRPEPCPHCGRAVLRTASSCLECLPTRADYLWTELDWLVTKLALWAGDETAADAASFYESVRAAVGAVYDDAKLHYSALRPAEAEASDG